MPFFRSSCRPHVATLSLAALTLATVPATRAATVTWGTAQNISADTNVLNGGTNAGLTVGAFRLGLPGLTAAICNGVTFQPFSFAEGTSAAVTIGNFALNPGGSVSTNTQAGTTAGAYGQLPAATQNLLQSETLSDNNGITLTMSGLTVGQTYTFQWWNNNAGNFTTYGYQVVRGYSGTAVNTNFVQLTGNTGTPLGSSPAGGVGQFAVGTFTADAASQSLYFRSSNDVAALNAFQLRTGNVPEPSTWAFVAFGAGLLSFFTLRRRAA